MKLLTVEDVEQYIRDEAKKLADRAVGNINAAATERIHQLEIQRDSLTLGTEISTLVQAATLFLADDIDTRASYSGDKAIEAWITVRTNGTGQEIPNVFNGGPRPKIPPGKYRILAFFLPISK